MDRKIFLKHLALTSTFTVSNPLYLAELFSPMREVLLPFPQGTKKLVTLLSSPQEYVVAQKINAQTAIPYANYSNNFSYNYLAPYQQWYSYQQAINYWNNFYYQQQNYYSWLENSYLSAMQQLLMQYQNYQQIGQPTIWNDIESLYAYVGNSYNGHKFIGLNSDQVPVSISNTIPGAGNAWSAVNSDYGENEAQRAVGPQSSEVNAAIKLPNNMQIRGKGYKTKNGALAVSDSYVQTEDNQIGKLVKYRTRKDGEQFLVV
jgi:hypothetical protein